MAPDRCRSSAYCGPPAGVLPRTRNTSSARRGGRPHPRNVPPRWFYQFRRCRTAECCCPDKSPCLPSCHPTGQCQSRLVRRVPNGAGPVRRSAGLNAVFIDEERILVRAVGRSPVLDDAQATGRDLLPDTMVQKRSRSLKRTPRYRCRVSLSGRSRSAVMTVVNPFCLSQSNRRRISARRIPGFGISPKSASMVSRTIRRAPTLWTASAFE